MSDVRFRKTVDSALLRLQTVVDSSRKPAEAKNIGHSYSDKFALTERVISTAMAAQVTSLEALGLTEETLRKVCASSSSASLRLAGQEECKFEKKREKKLDEGKEHITQYSSTTTSKALFSSKVVRKVTEYLWSFSFSYDLLLICGSPDSADSTRYVLQSWKGKTRLVTLSENQPAPKVRVLPPVDTSVTWLMQHISDSLHPTFHIDRSLETCRTPRRNADVNAALAAFAGLRQWASSCRRTLMAKMDAVRKYATFDSDMQMLSTDSLLLPIVPLFEVAEEAAKKEKKRKKKESHHSSSALGDGSASSSTSSSRSPRRSEKDKKSPRRRSRSRGSSKSPGRSSKSPSRSSKSGGSERSKKAEGRPAAVQAGLLVAIDPSTDADCSVAVPAQDVNLLLLEQKSDVRQKVSELLRAFPATDTLLSAIGATAIAVFEHIERLSECLADAVAYVEEMVREQLVAAIGREVTADDFAEYMAFHHRKLFKEEYAPLPFSHAVRREGHNPEGEVSITSGSLPLHSFQHESTAEKPMEIALSASSSARIYGQRHVHGLLFHHFGADGLASVRLAARARQFSSFILFAGRISSATLFSPSCGLVIRNKDELDTLLTLERLPGTGGSVSLPSISPEQLRFVEAMRAMQLHNSVFGLCVVDIKPQLERVLNLAPDSLLKEIMLSEAAQELFVKYQIPTSLLAYDEANDGAMSQEEQVALVKANVAKVQAIVQELKDKQLAERMQQMEMNKPPRVRRLRIHVDGTSVVLDSGITSRSTLTDVAVCIERRGHSMAGRSLQRNGENLENNMTLGFYRIGEMSDLTVVRTYRAPRFKPAAARASAVTGGQAPGLAEEGEVDRSDVTQLPRLLDGRFDELEQGATMRPTTLRMAGGWSRLRQASLLSQAVLTDLKDDELADATDEAFDLLDALTRSGQVDVAQAAIHTVISGSYCFVDSLVDTLVLRNVNPIVKLERASLIMASAVLDVPIEELILPERLKAVQAASPQLFA